MRMDEKMMVCQNKNCFQNVREDVLRRHLSWHLKPVELSPVFISLRFLSPADLHKKCPYYHRFIAW